MCTRDEREGTVMFQLVTDGMSPQTVVYKRDFQQSLNNMLTKKEELNNCNTSVTQVKCCLLLAAMCLAFSLPIHTQGSIPICPIPGRKEERHLNPLSSSFYLISYSSIHCQNKLIFTRLGSPATKKRECN